jgi:putative ABC transport system permease protein
MRHGIGSSGVRRSRAAGSLPSLALGLARQWWPQLAALACGCGVVAATIAGAVGVGDAMQRGLAGLAVARLGRIDAAVMGDDFFRARLADELAADGRAVSAPPARLVPAVVLEAAVDAAGSPDGRRRTCRTTLLACDDPVALGFEPPPGPLEPDCVAINPVLAEALSVRVGDFIVLRIADRSEVPADSPLGRRTGRATGRRLRVGQLLEATGLGAFSLRPTQVTPPLLVATLETAQAILRRGDVANAIFAVPDGPSAHRHDLSIAAVLRERLRPTMEDYGLSFDLPADAAAGEPAAARLTSRRLILAPEADAAAARVLAPLGGQPSLVFLANAMAVTDGGKATIPYSTVLGIESTSLPVGDLVDDAGAPLAMPGPDEIVIDRWMADDLAKQGRPVVVGDPLEIRFFLPEALHGRIEEASRTLRVSGIAAMRGAAVARTLVPEVEGVSDEKSIADWDPPFPFDAGRVRTTPPHDEDDRYWKEHGTTPKAFVSLETARGIAGSRFGRSTAWHVPWPAGRPAAELRTSLAAAIRAEPMGLKVVPLRQLAVAAAKGSTPFGGLFLALSSFVVVAGLLLEWLLFRLLVAARRRDVGILAAVGWPPSRIASLLMLVGGAAAVVGTAAGTAIAPFWSRLLLASLAGSWNAAVAAGSSQAFGNEMPSWHAVWPGALAAAAVSCAALFCAARRAAGMPPLVLLRGSGDPAAAGRPVVPRLLGRGRVIRTLPQLAWRGIASNRGRALSVAAIVALAEFLIVAVSSFALGPPSRPDDRAAPTGGWTHIATFGAPTGIDPSAPAVRESLGLTDDEQKVIAACSIARLRSNAGDDASCTNLYAAVRPTVIGLGPAFIDRGGFRFVAHAPLGAGSSNPWQLLERDAPAGGKSDAGPAPLPAILDLATAQWALKIGGVGATFTVPGDDGEPIRLEVVGLLEPGILQGFVLVAEKNFERMFPARSGYSLALVEAPADASLRGGVADAIAAAWADAGVTVQPALARLASLSAVQNTFLAAFQSLGMLGLLLGTAGVAAVQIQGVIERIGQFGLLQAIGFPFARIRGLVVIETILMVGLGLAVGGLAGVLTVLVTTAGRRAALPLGWIATTCLVTLAVAAIAGLVAARRAARVALRESLGAP